MSRRDLAWVHCKIHLRTVYSVEIGITRFITELAIARHVNDTFIVTMHRISHVTCDTRLAIGGPISRLIQMFARYSRGSDASIGLPTSSAGDKCVYDVSALPHLPSLARTQHGGRIAVLSLWGRGFTRVVIAVRHAVLQTAVNIVYWLPPPISQTLVTRSCRSPTANKPRAVI